MKIDRSEIAPSGKRRLCIYIGDTELELIGGMCRAALQYLPHCPITDKPRRVICAMARTIESFQREEAAERATWAEQKDGLD